MNFPIIIKADCNPQTQPPPDARCGDPAFALAHPEICLTTPVLRLKPGIALGCILGSVQFQTFLDQGGVEAHLTTGVIYSVSNPALALIGAISGNLTGIAPGLITVTATYGTMTA